MTSLAQVNALMQRLCASSGIFFSVASIYSSDESDFDGEAAAAGLVGEERSIYQNLRSSKRRREFVAGRTAAKQTLGIGAFSTGDGEIEIGRDPCGAPEFRQNTHAHLSISHSGTFAVAVAAPFPVGVDLECTALRPSSLVRYFYSDNERRLLNGLKATRRDRIVNQLWTRKEAAAKVGRWGGSLSFRELDCLGRTVTVQGQTLVLRSGSTLGFVASIAFKKEGSHG